MMGRRLLASTSHDLVMRLWDLSMLHDEEVDDEEEERDAATQDLGVQTERVSHPAASISLLAG
jgi:hypothetical protein